MSLSSQVKKAKAAQKQIPHVIIQARAGCGKTTTLIEGLKYAKGQKVSIKPSPQQKKIWDELKKSSGAEKICLTSFSNTIVNELKERVPPGVEARTMSSLGYGAVRNAFHLLPGDQAVDKHRVENILEEITKRNIWELRRQYPTQVKTTTALVDLCKMYLIDGTNEAELDFLVSMFDLELEDSQNKIYSLIPKILNRCKQVEKDRYIDFADQLWLPVVLDLFVPKFDLLLVDECLPGWTPVMMGNGKSKEIQSVKVGDVVRSFDVSKGRAKNCRVSAVQKLVNQKPLVKVKVRHNHKTAGNFKTNFVVCTRDHQVWTVNRGWIQSGELQIGDTVIVETSAQVTQKGKLTKAGLQNLSEIHQGNKKGLGVSVVSKEQFNRIKGGNGRGLTEPQRLLLEALGDEWKAEFVLTTGDGYKPHHYKIDLAHPRLKVAVELDGNSHNSVESREADSRKDEFLRSKGWTVYRILNQSVARDFAGVLQDICPDGSSCPMPATVESVDDTYINDLYVYDITVEDCHNFYANGILVHNCQDMNRCQHELALRMGRRLVLCGDDKQAIFQFAGADTASMKRMEERLTPSVTLVLNQTRRCGKTIVKEAQKFVPDFIAHESNPEGEVRYATIKAGKSCYMDQVQSGDMILSRTNAPLVAEVFRFLRKKRKAVIRGRNIGANLVSLVERLNQTSDGTIPEFIRLLEEWQSREYKLETAKKYPSEIKLQTITDKKGCLDVLAEKSTDVSHLIEQIWSIFDDNEEEAIILSTIHRAKGLEANQVFYLQNGFTRQPATEVELEAEQNLRYVAITRAKSVLVYVS